MNPNNYQKTQSAINEPDTHRSISWQRLLSIAPIGVCILEGSTFVIAFANDQYLSIIQKTAADILGVSLIDAMPELGSQDIIQILSDVYNTGKTYEGNEFPVVIVRNGAENLCYFNFVYQPIKNDSGATVSVMVLVNEVTSFIEKRQQLAESERVFKEMVLNSPIAMTIFRGDDWVIEMANKVLLEKIWKRSIEEVKGQKLLDVFPELHGQKFPQLLKQVADTKTPYRENESFALVNSKGELSGYYLDFEYAPLFDADGTVERIMVTVIDVTEKVQDRKKLEAAEERARIALEAGGMELFELSFNSAKIQCSDRLYEMLGIDAGDMSFEVLRSRLAEEDDAVRIAAFQKAVETGWLSFETRAMVDDKIEWFSIQGKLELKHQLPYKVVGTVKNISAEKDALKRIEENEVRLRLATDGTRLATWDLDLKTNRVSFSSQLPVLLGLQLVEFHHHLRIGLHEEDKALVNQRYSDALISGKYFYEARFWVEGDLRWMRIKGTVLYNEVKEPYRMLGTLEDITEEKNAELKLIESEARFRAVADTAPVMIWMCNAQQQIDFFNKGWRAFSEYDMPPDIVPDLLNFIHPDDAPIVKEHFKKAFAAKDEFYMEYRRRRRDGQWRWVSDNGIPRYNSEGEFVGYVGGSMDIDDQKSFSERIKRSEDRLRFATQSTGLGTFDFDLLTNTLVWDDRCKQLFGLGKDDTVSYETTFVNGLHPEDRDATLEAVNNSMLPESNGTYEAEYRTVDGQGNVLYWIRAKGKTYFANGKPVRLVGTVLDITQQKKSVEALANSELLFKTIANVSPVGLWMTNAIGETTFVNNTWQEWTGCSLAYHKKEGWEKAIAEKDGAEVSASFIKSFEERASFHEEFRFVKKNHDTRWGLSIGYPFYDSSGEFGGFAGSITDITEQKKLEEELERKVEERTQELDRRNSELKVSEERYHRMVNEVQDYAIIFLNENGIIQNWNKGAEKIKGYTEQEIIGEHFRIFYAPEDKANGLPEKTLADAAHNGRASLEGWRMRKDGTRFWGSIVMTALHDDRGVLVGFSKVTRDLTEKKIAEEELKEKTAALYKANAALEKSNSELEQYAYVASHDLQEPLRKISTYSGLLSEKIKDMGDPALLGTVDKILSSSARMSQLIKDLLNFSRLLNYEKSFEAVDLNQIFVNILTDLELPIQQKNASVILSGLPVIEAIPLQMNQLFYNLLNNSLKFSRSSMAPVIEVTCRDCTAADFKELAIPIVGEERFVLICFKDNGIGFDQQYAAQIFEIFKRLYNSKAYSGSGIGLALCKRIVANHNGFIDAIGRENEGAVFNIFLPVTQKT